MSTPAQYSGTHSHSDARRSARIERRIPLVIIGTDKLGRPFQEETFAVSLNLHGCRYASRHEYPIASRVTLKVAGTKGTALTRVARARVCTIHPPQTSSELCHVGVEFETPGNVWSLDGLPNEWLRQLGEVPAITRSATAVAPACEAAKNSSPILQAQTASEERRVEVTKFPAPTSTPALSDRAREIAHGKPEPVVARADELVAYLQKNLQQTADNAVENAITTHLEDAVRKALERIDEASKLKALQVARISELQSRAVEQLGSHCSRAEEIARRLELLMSSARSNFSEMQGFVEQVTGQLEPQLHARLNESFDRASQELENTAAQVSERQFANFTEGTQAVFQEALLQLDARMAAARPLFENAMNVPSPEHMKTLLHSMKEETLACVEASLQEICSHWEEQQELQRNHLELVAQKLEKLAGSPILDLGNARKLVAQSVRELEPQVYARLEESVGRAAQDFETEAACAADRQLVRLMEEKQRVAHEASLEIEAAATEARALLQKTANVTLDEFRRQLGVQIDLAMSEATQRMASSLASLDAENRLACEARRHALESDVSRTAEKSTQEFRTGMKAFLYSCLVAAVSAVDEHAQTTLHGLDKNSVSLPPELMPSSGASGKGVNGSSGDDYSQ